MRLCEPACPWHIADVVEPFRSQQFFGHVLRGDAELELRGSRIVVVSGGPSSASDGRALRTPVAPATDGRRGNRGETV